MIERKKLNNGLRVIGQKKEGYAAFTFMVSVNTGSRNESEINGGISHFLEHMCFKGTKKRPNKLELMKELDGIGAESNAATGKELTIYYVKADRRHFRLVADILSDMVYQSLFLQEEIEKERGTILQEYNMYEDSPMELVPELLEEILFDRREIAQPIIGTKKSIIEISENSIKDYFSLFYHAGNSLVSCAGGLPNDYLETITEYFGCIPQKKKQEKKSQSNELFKKKVLLKYKDTEQTHIAYGVPGYGLDNSDKFPAKVLAVILGGNFTSRLFMEIREKRGLAYYIGANTQEASDYGIFRARGGLDTQKTFEAIKIIREQFESLGDSVTEEEVSRAKEYIKGNLALSEEDSANVAESNVEEIFGSNALTIDQKIKKYEAVTVEDVKRAAKDLIVGERTKLGIIGPFKNEEKFIKLLS